MPAAESPTRPTASSGADETAYGYRRRCSSVPSSWSSSSLGAACNALVTVGAFILRYLSPFGGNSQVRRKARSLPEKAIRPMITFNDPEGGEVRMKFNQEWL